MNFKLPAANLFVNSKPATAKQLQKFYIILVSGSLGRKDFDSGSVLVILNKGYIFMEFAQLIISQHISNYMNNKTNHNFDEDLIMQ